MAYIIYCSDFKTICFRDWDTIFPKHPDIPKHVESNLYTDIYIEAGAHGLNNTMYNKA